MNTDESSSFWSRHRYYIFAFVAVVVIIYFTNGCAPREDLDVGYNQMQEYKLQKQDFSKLLRELDKK